MSSNTIRDLRRIHEKLKACRKCKNMQGRSVHGPALETDVMLVGQAPGTHEERLGKPFAYTAGRTLFKWLGEALNMSEDELREAIYITAVARCFPGKASSGSGDREPNAEEIKNCSEHLGAEINAIKPKLIIAVGKVALAEVLKETGHVKSVPLVQVVGKKIKTRFHGIETNVIALPHPSGVSRWPNTEPGKTKLKEALALLREEFNSIHS